MTSDNYDYAYDMLIDMLCCSFFQEQTQAERIEIFETVISKFVLTDSEKAELFQVALRGIDD